MQINIFISKTAHDFSDKIRSKTAVIKMLLFLECL